MSYPLVTLGDVAEFINGFAFKPSHWGVHGKPIIRIQNLTDEGKPYNQTTHDVDDRYLVKAGDILVSWSATLDVFEWNREDALLNQHIFKVVPDYSRIDKAYFRYALKRSIEAMMKFTHGSTMKHVNRGDFLSTKIPLPNLEEQKHIAAILDRADAIRRKRQQAIQLTEEFLSSVFLDMFGDPVTNPKGWPIMTVGDVTSDVRDGPHVSPKYADTGVPFLSTRNVRPGRLVLEDLKYVSEKGYNELTSKFRPKKGDVLLTKGGTTGYAKAVDFNWPFAVWVHIAVLRPTSNIRPEFLEAALNSPSCYAQSQRYTHGIANRDLGLTRIRKIILSLPPLELQDRYRLIRSIILGKIKKNEKALGSSSDLFNSLCQRAFRGEL